MDPVNVPRVMDVRYAGWDQLEPTVPQLVKLRTLLRQERVDPAELYGDGFSSLEDLSRWGASWGITFLEAAEQARYVEAQRQRVERENAELLEQSMKGLIAAHFRRQAHG